LLLDEEVGNVFFNDVKWVRLRNQMTRSNTSYVIF